ncbi:DUF167 domain-containing protein [Kovacikia minuta CCNUW1]|uniref:DUF167 domain-containing protein n=1 Tax=Kovacikia minuta TaxID=2931930 RepID=UPI001CCF0848|nr:DUF167 domain-containing protein [Kovacikia minuta]UBF28762.1 DUF167 domain-containing protein [Kovacikia minuta CCNUW1]
MKILRLKVKPNSRQQMLQQSEDGNLIALLKSPPIEGKANQELIQLLAKEFDVPKSLIRIKAGASSKNKLVEIDI